MKRLGEIERLIEEKAYVDALQKLDGYLTDYPTCEKGRFLFASLMLETEKPAIARVFLESIVDSGRPEVDLSLGSCLDDLHQHEMARNCYRRALAKKPGWTLAIDNMAASFVKSCMPKDALHWTDKLLKIDPDSLSARVNSGFASLMLRDYERGWDGYATGLGNHKWRAQRNYAGEPLWDGSHHKRVIIYGEQGIGDQIFMASPIRDLVDDSSEVIIDTHRKLRGLFARSFGAETHGTMFERELEWPFDRPEKIDASCSLSQLQRFYRRDITKWDGKPYLVADPERRIQWRSLLQYYGQARPRIGISWTGGSSETQSRDRSTKLADLEPILRSIDATWVSLEYKPDKDGEVNAFYERTGIDVHDWPRATQTDDYDDTAALVAELDLVITIPQSVVHLAGALGVPCWTMLHARPHCFFGVEGTTMPQYNSVRLFRRKSDEDWNCIRTIAGELEKWQEQKAA